MTSCISSFRSWFLFVKCSVRELCSCHWCQVAIYFQWRKRRSRLNGKEWPTLFFTPDSSLLPVGFSPAAVRARWSCRRTWTLGCCSSSAAPCPSTPSSPSCLPASSAGSPHQKMGASMAQRRIEPGGRRHARWWDIRRDPTGRWAPLRSWWHHCSLGWTPWIRCSSTQQDGSHIGTVWERGRSSVRKMSNKVMERSTKR